jgi:hypothetical protein
MQFVGFPKLWRDCVAAILSITSTKVLFNGCPSNIIFYAHDLRQGDTLSLMLFLLVMEDLSALIRKAEAWSLLLPLGVRSIPYCASFYADNLVLFVSP